MDIGIRGRTAIVCAASKGLGHACAFALAREGPTSSSMPAVRKRSKRRRTRSIRETGVRVETLTADITSEEGRSRLLAVCPNPDILINNAGGPPPGDLRNTDRATWLRAIEANMLTPILLTTSIIGGMVDRRFGRIVNIFSAAVTAPGTYPTLGTSVGARAGLTGAAGVLARQVAAQNVTINALLPGPFATDRMREHLKFSASALALQRSKQRRAPRRIFQRAASVSRRNSVRHVPFYAARTRDISRGKIS